MDRSIAVTGLLIAAGDVPWTDAVETLHTKLIAAKEGDRSDPKIEAMIEALLELQHDQSLPTDEKLDAMEKTANKLVREYRP